MPPRQVSLLRLEVRSKTNSCSLIPGRRSRPAPIPGRETNLRALRVQVLRRKARPRAPGGCPGLQIDPRAHPLRPVPHPLLPAPREKWRPVRVPGPACNRLDPAAAAGAFLLLPEDRPAEAEGACPVVPAALPGHTEGDTAAARVQVVTLVVSAETDQWAVSLRKPVNHLQARDTSAHPLHGDSATSPCRAH